MRRGGEGSSWTTALAEFRVRNTATEKNHAPPQRPARFDANKQEPRETYKRTDAHRLRALMGEAGRSGAGLDGGVSSSIRAYLRRRLPLVFDASRRNGKKKNGHVLSAIGAKAGGHNFILHISQRVDLPTPSSVEPSKKLRNHTIVLTIEYASTLCLEKMLRYISL